MKHFQCFSERPLKSATTTKIQSTEKGGSSGMEGKKWYNPLLSFIVNTFSAGMILPAWPEDILESRKFHNKRFLADNTL